MKLTENELSLLLELEDSYKVGFATASSLTRCVFPSTREEVRKVIYSLQTKGAPIREVGLEEGGWRLESPRLMIRRHMDLIERSQKEIYKIMEFSNQKFYKIMDEVKEK